MVYVKIVAGCKGGTFFETQFSYSNTGTETCHKTHTAGYTLQTGDVPKWK